MASMNQVITVAVCTAEMRKRWLGIVPLHTVSDPAALMNECEQTGCESYMDSNTYYIEAVAHAASRVLRRWRWCSLINVPAKLGRSSPCFCKIDEHGVIK